MPSAGLMFHYPRWRCGWSIWCNMRPLQTPNAATKIQIEHTCLLRSPMTSICLNTKIMHSPHFTWPVSIILHDWAVFLLYNDFFTKLPGSHTLLIFLLSRWTRLFSLFWFMLFSPTFQYWNVLELNLFSCLSDFVSSMISSCLLCLNTTYISPTQTLLLNFGLVYAAAYLTSPRQT